MANRISVSDNTEALHAIGEYVMQYEAMQNAYLTALVNRIGMTIITSKMWDNPWSVFKKGRLEFGETVEEIFVNLAKPHSFDPATAEKEVIQAGDSRRSRGVSQHGLPEVLQGDHLQWPVAPSRSSPGTAHRTNREDRGFALHRDAL